MIQGTLSFGDCTLQLIWNLFFDHLATLILFFTDSDVEEATINGLGGLADGETGHQAQQQGCEATHGDMAQERSGAPLRRRPL